MATETSSKNWGAIGIANISSGVGLNVSGTIYLFRNHDNGDRFLFALADLGIGVSFGAKADKITSLVKTILGKASLNDVSSFTAIPANRSFSASDLNLARGAEATIGATATAGYSATVISAFPWTIFAPKPGEEVNNDYFSGVDVSGLQLGAGVSVAVAYRFYGLWFKLWSFQ